MISTQQAIDHLRPYLTDNRWDLMHDILRQRTRFLTVITEELYREHNANALLRSCECFGLQEMHVVDNINEFAIHRDMSRGAAKWVEINKHKDVRQCIEGLKTGDTVLLPHIRKPTIRRKHSRWIDRWL